MPIQDRNSLTREERVINKHSKKIEQWNLKMLQLSERCKKNMDQNLMQTSDNFRKKKEI